MLKKALSTLRRRFLGEELWRLSAYGGASTADMLRLNVKNFGYCVARELARTRLAAIDFSTEPRVRNFGSRPATQVDIESAWFVHWCNQLKLAPIYHRKLWEYAFFLQALFDHGALRPGASGLGFGCGEEPLASYLAANGATVTVTDLDPAQSAARGWIDTGQHTSAIDQAFKPELIDRARFDRFVKLRYVDMNAIPVDLHGRYDFCWSICAFEHLGSLERGLRFVENAMATLKPGGLAIHTTEFNYTSDDDTVETSELCLFQRKHFLELRRRLESAGHRVAPLEFGTGNGILDGFIDIPPYDYTSPELAHLKLTVGRFPTTCFGLIVEHR
jgi:SAM-dependent methyltransferase